MDQFYLMFKQVIIPFYVILTVFFLYTAIEVLRGYFLRPLAVFIVAMALLILFTDLRREIKFTRTSFSFNGVIYPTVEADEITMPVVFTEVYETGVITGGYDEARNI